MGTVNIKLDMLRNRALEMQALSATWSSYAREGRGGIRWLHIDSVSKA